jgi:hypothetical protein
MKSRVQLAVRFRMFVSLAVLVLCLVAFPALKKSMDLSSPSTVSAASPSVRPGWKGSPMAMLIPGYGIHAFQLASNCTLYAAANGNDANSGASPSSPKTLTGADGATSPGSVVCLLGGRYELSDTWTVKSSGTSGASVTFQSYGDGPVNIVWTRTTPDSHAMILISGTYDGSTFSGPENLIFQGLNLDGGIGNAALGGTVGGGAANGFQCTEAKGITFVGNTITNTGGAGIAAVRCDYVISDHNLIFHSGYNNGQPSYTSTSGITYNQIPWADTYSGIHNTISNNIVVGEVDQNAHTDGNGIIFDLAYGSNTTTPPGLIINNIVYGNGGRCIVANQYVANFWIVNNSCYKNDLDSTNEPNFGGIVNNFATGISNVNGFVLNNISYSWATSNPPYEQLNTSSNPGVTYQENLYYGAACSPTTICNGFINADPQFVTPPYFDPSAAYQYNAGRPPSPGRPNYRSTTLCSSSQSQLWLPTCDIDSGFALASTSPGHGNVGVDPTTLANDPNLQADLGAYVYYDINHNPRGGSTGVWDLGAYQH